MSQVFNLWGNQENGLRSVPRDSAVWYKGLRWGTRALPGSVSSKEGKS